MAPTSMLTVTGPAPSAARARPNRTILSVQFSHAKLAEPPLQIWSVASLTVRGLADLPHVGDMQVDQFAERPQLADPRG